MRFNIQRPTSNIQRPGGLPVGRWMSGVGRWALLFLLLFVLPGQGRVFRRWGGRADAGHTLASLGGVRAYAAPVTINGGSGQVDVYAFEEPLGETMRRIGRALDTPPRDAAGGAMVIRTVATPSGPLSLVAVALSDPTRTLVFALQQSGPGKGPAPLAELPAFPGSDPLFTATDERAHAGLALSATSATPAGARAFYREQLAAEGWSPALPAFGAGGGMDVYLRDRKLCCVQALPRDGQTHITLFYKELATPPKP